MGGSPSGRSLPHVDDLDGNIVLVVADLLDNAPQRRRRREVHASDAGEVEHNRVKIVLVGDPGVGKTNLLAHFIAPDSEKGDSGDGVSQ